MCRPAEFSDIPALVEMGAQFHAMSPHAFLGEYDPDGIANTLAYLISSPGGVLVTNGTGLIGGMIAPVYFAPSTLMLEESFWWARGGGGDLLKMFEEQGKEKGARFVLLSTLENEHVAAIDRVVQRRGYRPVERRYIKEL